MIINNKNNFNNVISGYNINNHFKCIIIYLCDVI